MFSLTHAQILFVALSATIASPAWAEKTPPAKGVASQPTTQPKVKAPAAGEQAATQPSTTTTTPREATSTVKSVLFPLAEHPQLTAAIHQAMLRIGYAIQLSSLSPEELMLAVGCNSYSVGCLQQVGKMVQANSLVLMRMDKAKKNVELRWFDVNSGADAGKHSFAPPPITKQAKALELVARTLFGMPAPKPGIVPNTGEMIVISKTPSVEIVLNGQPRGVAPLNLQNLGPGSYEVTARKRGHLSWTRKVTVEAGHITNVKVSLKRKPGYTDRPKSLFGAIGPHTWILAGAAVSALAVGIGFAADLASQQNEFDRLTGNTSYEIKRMESLRDRGDRDSLVANVMFSVAGALALATAIVAYLDYRGTFRAESPTAPAPPPGGAKVSFGVGPTSVHFGLRF
jgi:hypothetical protein